MTLTSIIFLLFGAIFLWGGLSVTLYIAIRERSK